MRKLRSGEFSIFSEVTCCSDLVSKMGGWDRVWWPPGRPPRFLRSVCLPPCEVTALGLIVKEMDSGVRLFPAILTHELALKIHLKPQELLGTVN